MFSYLDSCAIAIHRSDMHGLALISWNRHGIPVALVLVLKGQDKMGTVVWKED